MEELYMHGIVAIGAWTGTVDAPVLAPFGRTGPDGATVTINREQMSIETAMSRMEAYIADSKVEITVSTDLISAVAKNLQRSMGLPDSALVQDLDDVDPSIVLGETLTVNAEDFGAAPPIGLYIQANLPQWGTRTIFITSAKSIGSTELVIGKDAATLPKLEYKALSVAGKPVFVIKDTKA